MNRSDLVLKYADSAGVPKKKAELIIDTIFNSMRRSLESGDRIELRGFGSFVNKQYDSYVGRNPRTGATITVAPKKLPFFKVGKELKELIDK